jgi:predicted nucleic acid-binding protein
VIRAVIDTNVLVSAMISSAGNEALLIMAINQGLVTPYFSTEILNEYRDVLLRPRFGFPAKEVDGTARHAPPPGQPSRPSSGDSCLTRPR